MLYVISCYLLRVIKLFAFRALLMVLIENNVHSTNNGVAE